MRSYRGEADETRRWPLLPVLALCFAAWLICCWPWLTGAVTIPWDAKAHFQPQLQFLARSIHAGESFLWTPNVFSGAPQIADPQSLIFSPLFLLLALFDKAPSLRAMDATTFGALFAGAIAIVIFFRDRNWHWGGAAIAALIFFFGGSAAWRVQHIGQILSLSYLPIALLLLDRALQRSSMLYGAAAGLAAALIMLGRDQVSLLGLYVLAAWLVAHWLRSENRASAIRRSIAPLVAGAIVGAILTLPPIALTWLLAEQSNRPAIDFIGAGRGSLHPALLITTFIPHLFGAAYEMEKYWGPPSFAWRETGLFTAQNMGVLYIGAAPILLLVTSGIVRGALWSREIRFFSIGLLISLVYALCWYTPVFRLLYEALPGASLYRRPADATFLIGFFLAYGCGWLAHLLLTGAQPRRAPWQRGAELVLIISPFLAAPALGAYIGRMSMVPLPLIWASLSFAAGIAVLALAWKLTQAGRAHLAALALIAVTTGDLAFNNGPNGASALPPATYDVLRPDTRNETIAFLKQHAIATPDRRDRIELAALGFHWPNASLVHGLENTLGYNPVRLGLYTRATGAGDHVALPDQRSFSPLMPSYRTRLSDMLGLRFIATGVPIEKIDPSIGDGAWPPVARTADGFIYENLNALPRVLFASEAQTADFEQLLKDGRWPDVDPRRTVLLDQTVASPQPASRREGEARILRYGNSAIDVAVTSPDGGWLVLNDPWMPWWRATIDGVATPVLRANVLFRAVAVPPGEHRIAFRFAPFRGALAEIQARFGRLAGSPRSQ
ncbi:MAG: hypothetical protein ABWZ80_03235 [Beijerinckiaceae bacterium]